MIEVEICTPSRRSAEAAKAGGAQRVELCRDLACGGLTPTVDDVEYCVRRLGLRTHVLVRPRAGNFYYNAPVTIYISGDEAFGWSAVDAGIAVENIHLAAAAMGLGSVILGCMKKVLNGEKKAEYAEKLGFPEGYGYQVAIAVGYPDTTKDQHAFDYEKNVTIL